MKPRFLAPLYMPSAKFFGLAFFSTLVLLAQSPLAQVPARTRATGLKRPAAKAAAPLPPPAVPPPASEASANNPENINFEGEVIEGEQGIPTLLQDFDAQGATLDLIVLKRADFNDSYNGKIDLPFRYQSSRTEKEH